MRILTIISGILLVLTGVFCFANPGETFLSLAFILGLMMVINSIIQGIAYWWGRAGNQHDNNGWILTEAVITFILGILVLSNQIAADVAIPMVFGMWAMFSGILRVVTATMIDRHHKKANFIWTLATGLLCALGGLYAFLNPIIAGLAIAVLLGIMFVVQGISTLELGVHMPHEKKVKQGGGTSTASATMDSIKKNGVKKTVQQTVETIKWKRHWRKFMNEDNTREKKRKSKLKANKK